MKKLLTLFTSALLLLACGGNKNKPSEPMADTGRTQRTENLLGSLQRLSAEGKYMFGHHDDTVYGIGWVGDSAHSDVQSVCADLPALLSFDLGRIELGDSANLDRVPFERMRQEIIRHYDRGGVVTLSWHAYNPLSERHAWVADSLRDLESQTVASVLEGGEQHAKFLTWLDRVAQFLNSLQTPYGIRVPVIFRPWHEHTGSWFWWGQSLCSTEQYKALWQLTVSELKKRGVVNALYAYSPSTEVDGDSTKYMERYPGDDCIDLLGLDSYCFAPDADTTAVAQYAAKLDKNLSMVCQLAQQHGKAAALTETGYEGLKTADWWTHTLAPVLSRHPVSYVLVWRNAHDKPGHFFAPYPGQLSVSDFIRFYNDPATLFLHDVNGLYLGQKKH
jgi:mannan endo-1,4-beta-mannosidase